MKSYLKVKVCTLAAESKSIKLQMRKWKKRAASARARERDPRFAEANYFGLRGHRVGKEGMAKELRDSNLAYGFLCNRPYHVMEAFAYSQPNWENIERMVKRYGGVDYFAAIPDNRDVMQRFSSWKDTAIAYAAEATEAHHQAAAIKAGTKPPHRPGTWNTSQLGPSSTDA